MCPSEILLAEQLPLSFFLPPFLSFTHHSSLLSLPSSQAIIEDVKEHHESLESLESAVSDVLTLVEEEEDQRALSQQLEEVTQRYNRLLFDSSCYPVDRWLEDHSNQLVSMAPSGVLVVALQVDA